VERKKVLVTGGAGFIGSHLVEKLVQEHNKVTVLDNLSSGKKQNLATVIGDIDLVEGDIREYEAVTRALNDVDVVVHLAALISVPDSVGRPLIYHEINTTGALNVLQQSALKGVKKFIYASTCAVYGEPTKIPIKEHRQLMPLSPYATSKLCAEEYCRTYDRIGKINSIILRFFNVYGPRQSFSEYSGAISTFIERIRNGQPPIIYGDGEQTRDFVHVDDVVNSIMKAIQAETNSGTFNIGTGNATEIRQLAKLLLNLMNRQDLKPEFADPKVGDIKQSKADISEAKKAFGYSPQITLEEGLKRILGHEQESERI
jgi:UDP-glucose 4-epimerase